MSPELETLDQLLGGDLPLPIGRRLYPNDQTFGHATVGLLFCGDARLVSPDGSDLPQSRRCEVFFSQPTLPTELDNLKLRITEQGVRRIK